MIFTSEQISNGHPDKICDQISDAILTNCLRNDRNSRVAVECLIKDYDITIAGELTSRHKPDCHQIVSEVLTRIGLPNVSRYRLHIHISRQSPDIALGARVLTLPLALTATTAQAIRA